MAKELNLSSQINDLMEEYRMLLIYKSRMENKVKQLEKTIEDLKQPGNSRFPKHSFVSNMEANIISVEKEIKDTIIQMKNIKKDIIDLTMKEYKLDNDEDSDDKFQQMSKAILSQLNSMKNDEIIDSISDSEEDDDFDNLGELNNALDNLEDQSKEEREKEIKEDLDKEVEELDQQDVASVLKVYKGELNFFVMGDDPDEYELVVADKDLNIIEDDELKDDYPKLFTLTKDLTFEDIKGEDDLVQDEFGNIYQKADY